MIWIWSVRLVHLAFCKDNITTVNRLRLELVYVFPFQIVDETDAAQYRRKLRDWENERERQMYEFTITDKDIQREKQQQSRCKASRSLPSGLLAREGNSTESHLYTVPADEKIFKPYKVN